MSKQGKLYRALISNNEKVAKTIKEFRKSNKKQFKKKK